MDPLERGRSKPMRLGVREEYRIRVLPAICVALLTPVLIPYHFVRYALAQKRIKEIEEARSSNVRAPEKIPNQ